MNAPEKNIFSVSLLKWHITLANGAFRYQYTANVCLIFRLICFLNFVHRPVFYRTLMNTTFRKLDVLQRSLEYSTMNKFQRLIIQNVTHHRQKPPEPTSLTVKSASDRHPAVWLMQTTRLTCRRIKTTNECQSADRIVINWPSHSSKKNELPRICSYTNI
jgi:hypothetical protein